MLVFFLLFLAGPWTIGCSTFHFQGNRPQLRAQAGQLTRQARTALSRGSSQLAKRLLNHSLECCPDDPQALALLAEANLESGDAGEAISKLMDVAEKAPERTDIRVRLGRAWMAAGQLVPARIQAEQAIVVDPQYGPAWILAGDLGVMENSFDEALTNYHRAAGCPDPDKSLELRIARVYQSQGRANRALSAVEKYQSQFRADTPCHQGLMLEGEILMALGQNSRAIERLTMATAQPAASPESFVILSRAQILDNRALEARQTLMLAREKWPVEPLLIDLIAQLDPLTPGENVVAR